MQSQNHWNRKAKDHEINDNVAETGCIPHRDAPLLTVVVIEFFNQGSDRITGKQVAEKECHCPRDHNSKHDLCSYTECLGREDIHVKDQDRGFCETQTDNTEHLASEFALPIGTESVEEPEHSRFFLPFHTRGTEDHRELAVHWVRLFGVDPVVLGWQLWEVVKRARND